MKIVLAFDSFKGGMSAAQACRAAASGIRQVCGDVETVELPMSDGGEGLVECVRRIVPVVERDVVVSGPLMTPVKARYALSPDGTTAYMEMAAAAGLSLVPPDMRNPLLATTCGVGEMMADAMGVGCDTIVMGIGGSATCDGGRGMIEALERAGRMNTTCRIVAACDVSNPLYGENGAACVFAPQKGATPGQVKVLDRRLREFARHTEQAGMATPELAHHPGAGAAGGLGYALLAWLHARLCPGIDIMMDLADFDEVVRDADLVITGEGKSDCQTLMGKVAHGVSRRCKRQGIGVWLLSGLIDDCDGRLANNFSLVESINRGDARRVDTLMKPEVAMENMRRTVSRLFEAYCRDGLIDKS